MHKWDGSHKLSAGNSPQKDSLWVILLVATAGIVIAAFTVAALTTSAQPSENEHLEQPSGLSAPVVVTTEAPPTNKTPPTDESGGGGQLFVYETGPEGEKVMMLCTYVGTETRCSTE